MTLEERIIKSLDKIRPYIQRDGGDMEFVSVDENGIVTVMLNKDDSRLRNNLLYYEEKFNDITDDNKAISIIINEIKSLL